MFNRKQFSEVMKFLNAHYKICFNNKKVSGHNFDNFTQNQPYYLHYHLWLQQVPHFHAYTVPSLSDGVVAMDSLIIHVPAEDDVAKLPVQRKKVEIMWH
jgi:uncharacterized protein (DUF1919 family)